MHKSLVLSFSRSSHVQHRINYSKSLPPYIRLFSNMDDTNALDAVADEAASDNAPKNSIFAGVAKAKVSGILCVALLLSQGTYIRESGDPWAVNGILHFPPGGSIVAVVGTISGLYTLWTIQPVLKAVQASIEAQDTKRRMEAQGQEDGNDR